MLNAAGCGGGKVLERGGVWSKGNVQDGENEIRGRFDVQAAQLQSLEPAGVVDQSDLDALEGAGGVEKTDLDPAEVRAHVEQSGLNAVDAVVGPIDEPDLRAAENVFGSVEHAKLKAVEFFREIDDAELDAGQIADIVHDTRVDANHARVLRVGKREADAQHGRILRTDLHGREDADREDGNDRRTDILGFGFPIRRFKATGNRNGRRCRQVSTWRQRG